MSNFYNIKTKDDVLAFIVLLVLVFFTSFFIATGMKLYFKAPRPCVELPGCPASYSFPSRHAVVIFALATAVSLQQRDNRINILLYLFAIVISIYRLFIVVHRPVDIVAGAIIGIVVGYLSKSLYKFYQKNLYYKLKFR